MELLYEVLISLKTRTDKKQAVSCDVSAQNRICE